MSWLKRQEKPDDEQKSHDKEEESENRREEESENPQYKHTMAAITAITDEDLEFFTPEEETEEYYTAMEPPSRALKIEPTIEEEPQKEQKNPVFPVYVIESSAAGSRRGSYQPRRGSYLMARKPLLRSQTTVFKPQVSGVFGSNKENVERILQRMASAIKKDLKL